MYIKDDWKEKYKACVFNSMTNQTPTEEKIKKVETLRILYKDAAMALIEMSNEKTYKLEEAIKGLENSLTWAVKSIILN